MEINRRDAFSMTKARKTTGRLSSRRDLNAEMLSAGQKPAIDICHPRLSSRRDLSAKMISA